MTDWITKNKGAGPWPFTHQPNKWGYSNNPRWTDTPSSPVNYDNIESEEPQIWTPDVEAPYSSGDSKEHIPCGHWHKKEQRWRLSITKSGSGTGVVTSNIPGINCGTSCSCFFEPYTVVVLTATPDADNSFIEWSGDGTGDTTRTVIMDGDKTVNADFSFRMTAVDMQTDGIYLYLVGQSYYPSLGKYYARVEKRDPITFELLDYSSLGDVGGALTYFQCCYIDGNDIYVGGSYDPPLENNYRQIIQKRNKNNLSSITWTFNEAIGGGYTDSRSLIADATQVYSTGTYGGSLVLKNAINKATGAKVWQFNNTNTSSGGISDDGNYIFIHKHNGGLRALEKVNRVTGTVVADTSFAVASNHFQRGVYNAGQGALYVGGVNTAAPSPSAKNFVSKVSLGSPMTEVWKYNFPVAATASNNASAQYYGGSVYVVGMTTVSSAYKLYIIKLADDGSTVEATWTSPETQIVWYHNIAFIGGRLYTYVNLADNTTKLYNLNRITLT